MIGIDEVNLPGLKKEAKEGHQRVELFLSCKKMREFEQNTLLGMKIKLYSTMSDRNALVAETELIKDSLNPEFTKTIILNYIFEKKQSLVFKLVNSDEKETTLEVLGEIQTNLGDIMGSKNQIAILTLMNGNKYTGKLIINAEIIEGSSDIVTLQIVADNLKKSATITEANPYFELTRMSGEVGNVKVYKSEIIAKTFSPYWRKLHLSKHTLCNNDVYTPIQLCIYTNRGQEKILLGECTLTLDTLIAGDREFFLGMGSDKKSFGCIRLTDFAVLHQNTFLEYLRGGVQLSVVLGIDFTQSNGDPKSADSKHCIRREGILNEYQQAIQSVCEILLCYDFDKRVPVYGFGGKPNGVSQVNHCFPLTGNEDDPFAYGLDGIMSVYKESLETIKLSGPTLFRPLLKKATEFAIKDKTQGSEVYTILLILTDGLIHDMQPTIDTLVGCSELPLSVIIIGVGFEDFTKMMILDGDNRVLTDSRGKEATRDLVQFVPFVDYGGDSIKLAEEVLAEVPGQFLTYMRSQNIQPHPREKIDLNKLISSKLTLSDKLNNEKTQLSLITKSSIGYVSDDIPDEKDAEECVEDKMTKLNNLYEKRFFHKYPNGIKSPKQKTPLVPNQNHNKKPTVPPLKLTNFQQNIS